MRSAFLILGFALVACDKPKPPEPAPVASASVTAVNAGSLGVSKPAPERVVAVGDLHGDIEAARRALKLAGAIDAKDAWAGGKLVLVQTGDLIDRGDGDRLVLDLFEHLKDDAPKAGGEVIALVGNHEIMNAQLDFRYVTDGAYAVFADVTPANEAIAQAVTQQEAPHRGRVAAFLPGGPYAKMLARRPVIARVGDSLFVHGGILPKHVRAGLDEINREAKEWLLGERSNLPKALKDQDGPLWTRMYSTAPGKEECATLVETLELLHAKRLVMGHTVQNPDISPACDGHGWRIDTGMSKGIGPGVRNIEVLELRGDKVEVLKEPR